MVGHKKSSVLSFLVFHNRHLVVEQEKSVEMDWEARKIAPIVTWENKHRRCQGNKARFVSDHSINLFRKVLRLFRVD